MCTLVRFRYFVYGSCEVHQEAAFSGGANLKQSPSCSEDSCWVHMCSAGRIGPWLEGPQRHHHEGELYIHHCQFQDRWYNVSLLEKEKKNMNKYRWVKSEKDWVCALDIERRAEEFTEKAICLMSDSVYLLNCLFCYHCCIILFLLWLLPAWSTKVGRKAWIVVAYFIIFFTLIFFYTPFPLLNKLNCLCWNIQTEMRKLWFKDWFNIQSNITSLQFAYVILLKMRSCSLQKTKSWYLRIYSSQKGKSILISSY